MAEKNAKQNAAETQPALSKHEDFVLKYKNMIIAGVVLLIAIIAGVIFYNKYKAAQQEEAATVSAPEQLLLSQAVNELGSPTAFYGEKNYEAALNGDSLGHKGFLKIAEEYSSTDAGNLANLYAGLCYAHLNKWEDAVKYLEKYDDAGDILISPAALGALGNAYAHVNQMDKAVSTLTKAAEKADNLLLSPIYYIQAGEILESQGKKAEALKLYQKVKGMQSMTQSSPYVDRIDEYIERVSE